MPETSRTLIVTGASSGIGRALALAGARAGFRAVITARRRAELEEVAGSIRSDGGACVTLDGDITAPDMPARIVSAAAQAFARIDVIVNNAGLAAYGALLDQSDAALAEQWQLHVLAPLRLARSAIAQLEATRGQLVFVGSGVARVPLPLYGGYSLAKAAIRAAAIQLRRELRPRHIAVTYVDPGVVATEFHSRIGITRTTEFVASPERIARAILRGIARRSAVVNGVPWQTALTALGEWSGTLADPIVSKRFAPSKVEPATPPVPYPPELPFHPEPFDKLRTGCVEGGANNTVSIERALEPVARRMSRVNLPVGFLRDTLVPGATLELNALAMRWAGMPNKNERAALEEALEA
ncbi:MAG: SDR family NAD(P)-dependent oxidoreductase, partial [Candidatus Eremiobacteraeota bacterium]|nr:SDR family NAD(P)-dependent oxidoreductase [Candidatus Eremiobacteraeota bacterium]